MPAAIPPALQALVEDARADGRAVLTPDDRGYETARVVKNARFDQHPAAIALCKGTDDLRFWLRGLGRIGDPEIPVSIRSGGHQHEGMSGNDGGVVLRLGDAGGPEISDDLATVRLGAGTPLGQVIDHLADHRRILPTGGCGSVNVGGLTHGGGWGMSYRTWGLTCDALREVEMVLPNGDCVQFDRERFLNGTGTELDVSASELFWAVSGGGGGNFGAVTRFLFDIFDPGPCYTEFVLQWERQDRIAAAALWAGFCNSAPEALNTYARMTLVPEGPHDEHNPAFLIGGRWYGDEADCRAALQDFLDGTLPPVHCDFTRKDFDTRQNFRRAMLVSGDIGGGLQSSAGNALPAQGYALQVGALGKGGPDSTCNGTPEPHKISSTFPAASAQDVMARADAYLNDHADFAATEGVNLYLSLHGLGGRGARIDPQHASFPWRGMDYLLQVQAWWLHGAVDDTAVLAWVDGFREALGAVGTGAFINFPDRNQSIDQYYDSATFDRLRGIKRRVDPGNLLRFDMSIPPG